MVDLAQSRIINEIFLVKSLPCRILSIQFHFISSSIILVPRLIIRFSSCSTQLDMKYIRLLNVKMLTIVGILTFISMINTTSESSKAIKSLHFSAF